MGRFVLLDTPRLPAKVEAFGFRGCIAFWSGQHHPNNIFGLEMVSDVSWGIRGILSLETMYEAAK